MVRLLAASFLIVITAVAPAQDAADWKVGLAQVKITPAVPVHMSGYGSRNKPYEKIETDLYAKALVLEDAKGKRAVIVTSDLLGFPAAVAEPICDRLREKLGLQREQIVINSSHTHTGPVVSLAPGGLPAGDAQRTIEYTKSLQDKVVDLVVKASAKLEPARLSHGTGIVNFVMNRREFTPTGVILGVNSRGLADRSVPLLRIDGADGKLKAVLFGAACHNTTLGPQNYEICGDFAGFSQAFIQEKHTGAQAMFMIGCGGDANPYPRTGMEDSRRHGAELGKEVCRVLEAKLRPVRGPVVVAFGKADLPLQLPGSRDEAEKWAKEKGGWRAPVGKSVLALLDKGEKPPATYPAPFSVIQLGNDLTWVGLSGEVVVDYVALIEKAIGPNNIWVSAYCNDVYGYLPSAKVLAEGGYETRGLYSGGFGQFDPKAQDVVVQKIRELAEKAGRTLPK